MQNHDPIVGQSQVPATAILGVTFMVIMLAMLALVHTVRMCVHAVRCTGSQSVDLLLPSKACCCYTACLTVMLVRLLTGLLLQSWVPGSSNFIHT